MPVQWASAVEFLGRAESGRSNPMKCLCEFSDGSIGEVFVKFEGFHSELSVHHLTAELIGNQLARDMLLPAATPCLVNISSEFLEVLPESDSGGLREIFQGKKCVAFGSRAFYPVRNWSPNNLIRQNQLQSALQLYLFDTITENSDRGCKNPNLLVSGGNFRIIDFGHCFERCHEVGAFKNFPYPWQRILNHNAGNLQHVLYQSLKKSNVLDFLDFTNTFGNLSDDAIEEYVNVVPLDWSQETACKIVDYLLLARENCSVFETKAREVLR